MGNIGQLGQRPANLVGLMSTNQKVVLKYYIISSRSVELRKHIKQRLAIYRDPIKVIGAFEV
jgi:hypothetical protein